MSLDLECTRDCQFNHFFINSREAMFITARDGSFLEVNDAFLKLLNVSREDITGKTAGYFFEDPEDRDKYVSTIEENGVIHDYQAMLKKGDGTGLLCLIDAVVWKNIEDPQGFCGIIRIRSELMDSFQSFFSKLKVERDRVREERRTMISDSMLLMRYGSDDLFEYVNKTGKNPLETTRRKVTILFFDIKGSTSIAEKLDADVFAKFLSDIFIDIMDLIYGNNGSVNKMLGDGLMATFGAPMSTGVDAFNAVNAAKKIEGYLQTYNDVRPDYLPGELEAGIGIATGSVFAGVIGSVRREEYTVLGDTVNIAARLESLTREIDGNILLDETTYREIQGDFPSKKAFRCKIKGREQSSRIFSV